MPRLPVSRCRRVCVCSGMSARRSTNRRSSCNSGKVFCTNRRYSRKWKTTAAARKISPYRMGGISPAIVPACLRLTLNTTFKLMRGGTFPQGYRLPWADLGLTPAGGNRRGISLPLRGDQIRSGMEQNSSPIRRLPRRCLLSPPETRRSPAPRYDLAGQARPPHPALRTGRTSSGRLPLLRSTVAFP